MYVDLRGLNEHSVEKHHPLPRINEVFDKLQGATVVNSIDYRAFVSG